MNYLKIIILLIVEPIFIFLNVNELQKQVSFKKHNKTVLKFFIMSLQVVYSTHKAKL